MPYPSDVIEQAKTSRLGPAKKSELTAYEMKGMKGYKKPIKGPHVPTNVSEKRWGRLGTI